MSKPQIDILGVHSLDVTPDLLKEQMQILIDDDWSEVERRKAERQIKRQLESIVLIEVLVTNPDSHFRIDDFTQPIEELPRENWQAAWAETYLTPDGKSLLVKRWGRAPKSNPVRIAFFLHYWSDTCPLRTSYGDLDCPERSPMPSRLRELVPYESVD